MEYHFKYSLTENEYADYNIFTTWTAPWQKKVRVRTLLTYFIICFVFSILAAINTAKSGKPSRNISFIIPVSLIISLVIGYLAYSTTRNTIKSRAIKFIRKEENVQCLGEYEITLNEDRIIDANEKSNTTYSWGAIIRFAETDTCYYLYTNEIYALILPKRIFKGQAELEGFNNFIVSKIPLSSSFRSLNIG